MRCYMSYDTKKILYIKNLELMVERIMSIQEFVFQLSNKVQLKHTVKIARSHLYELIAVSRGYKSYNALIAQNIIINAEFGHNFKNGGFHSNDIHQALLKKLHVLLKSDLPDTSYKEIAQTLHTELLLLKIESINLPSIREELSYMDFADGLIQSDEDVDFEEIKCNLDQIKSYAEDRHNPDACAVMAGYYRYLANQIAPNGKQWSNFGAIWSNTQFKYIQNEETRKNKALYESYIQQAETFEEKIRLQPINLNELLSEDYYYGEQNIKDNDEFYQKLIYVCRLGDVEAIELYLYDDHFKSLDDAWTYVYLAQMLGVDFTRDDYKAYNADTGEEYDGYGPLEAIGRDAIDIPPLDSERNELAKERAKELFDKM
uniref:hypothetical protein n=2 Tax=Moraxellaceae TaxID=468 RepID=UPI0005B3572B|nr:hypothetical protein [Acinetobacter radioresistens]EKU3442198.1 hypothetical protein [Acinetobacter baumannii]